MATKLATHRHLLRSGVFCISLASSMAARADDSPAVTPYRPSVSTPATLSAPGWLEIEAGVQNTRGDDPARRATLPYTLKLAFTPDWGIRIGGDAFVYQVGADGPGTRGGGDTTVVLKRRLAVNEASAFGLELAAKLPTARVGLGSGHSDVGVTGIYSSDFAETWHTDINVSATHIGGSEDGLSRWRVSWAASLSRNLTEQWGVVGELSGTEQTGNSRTSQALIATSYSLSRAVTLDIGVSRGFNSASGGWSLFSGITFLVAHLF